MSSQTQTVSPEVSSGPNQHHMDAFRGYGLASMLEEGLYTTADGNVVIFPESLKLPEPKTPGVWATRMSAFVEFAQTAWRENREHAKLLRDIDPNLGIIRRTIRNRTNLESDILGLNDPADITYEYVQSDEIALTAAED